MIRPGARTARVLTVGLVGLAGCATADSPIRSETLIRTPTAPPELPPPPAPDPLPAPPAAPPAADPSAPLRLGEVQGSVLSHFPLLYATEQEREVAAGQRLTAEGQFDTTLRVRGVEQGGTFSNGVLDAVVEQPALAGGVTSFAGWRFGPGNFPVYNAGRKTGDGGEFRAGLAVPLLQNRAIDPRRARLRAAEIAERLADPAVRRARLDYLRAAAQSYWTWVAAGTQYQVAVELLRLARTRQGFVEDQAGKGAAGDIPVALNRRLIASREEAVLAAERAVQGAAVRLSLYLRTPTGDPVVPPADRLPPRFLDQVTTAPDPAGLPADVQAALALRPELVRFRLQKERASVELALATNQLAPTLNVFTAVAQDVGAAKKTFTGEGPFRTDRTTAEVGAEFALPVQRRDALGRIRTLRGQVAQLLAQERFARDDITAQVQDAVSELVQTHLRVDRARQELREAVRVRDLEVEAFRAGRVSLVELNLQELAAAEAQVKVVSLLAAYYRAAAEYLAAVGVDPLDPPRPLFVLPDATATPPIPAKSPAAGATGDKRDDPPAGPPPP